jgi:hypothetical protein
VQAASTAEPIAFVKQAQTFTYTHINGFQAALVPGTHGLPHVSQQHPPTSSPCQRCSAQTTPASCSSARQHTPCAQCPCAGLATAAVAVSCRPDVPHCLLKHTPLHHHSVQPTQSRKGRGRRTSSRGSRGGGLPLRAHSVTAVHAGGIGQLWCVSQDARQGNRGTPPATAHPYGPCSKLSRVCAQRGDPRVQSARPACSKAHQASINHSTTWLPSPPTPSWREGLVFLALWQHEQRLQPCNSIPSAYPSSLEEKTQQQRCARLLPRPSAAD